MNRRDILKWAGVGSGAGLFPMLGQAASSAGIPVLPQKDTVLNGMARNADLLAQRSDYQWAYDVPNVVGVPMCSNVPSQDQPSLEWLVQILPALLSILDNALLSLGTLAAVDQQSRVASLRQQWQDMQASVLQAQTQFKSLMQQFQGASTVDSHTLATMADMQVQLAGILARAPSLWANLRDIVQSSFPAGASTPASASGLAAYDAMFVTLPRPPGAAPAALHDDNLFAYLRVAGPNPVLLRRVSALPSKFPLTAAQYQQVMGSTDSLSAALSGQRLYMIDYVQLGAMAPAGPTTKSKTGDGYCSAPMALFAVPKGGKSLVPVAIQCGQDPSKSPMFLRPQASDTVHYWGWQMAKTVVQTADFNYHEMFVHLGRTHLVAEAFHVATRRCLASTHPVNVLLLPHFEGDLFINDLAAKIILEPGTFGDLIEAPTVQALQNGAGADRIAFDFYAQMPPTDFAARGVNSTSALPDYPYRDDALLIWGAILQWATDYVNVYYLSDADVTGDTELSAWTQELLGSGKLKNFRAITSRSQLAQVLAMVMFTVSAQHAAVNFTQPYWMGYAPFSAGMTAADVPNRTDGKTEADWLRMLPGMVTAFAQTHFLPVLGSVHYRPLGDYRAKGFPYPSWFGDTRITQTSGPLPKFQAKLKQIETTIATINLSRSRAYTFLLPSLIPTSINI
jgi:arachidonate 15-lipoxygenase